MSKNPKVVKIKKQIILLIKKNVIFSFNLKNACLVLKRNDIFLFLVTSILI